MPRNIEIKARLADRAAVEAQAIAAATAGPIPLLQDDTFFACARGRLKLRESAPDRGELIAYQREDIAAPRASTCTLTPTDAPARLREALASALDVTGRVRKQRTLYLAGRSRIHLDRVEGLGDFAEIEVVLADDEPEAAGLAEAHALMATLGLTPADLEPRAYVDLLATTPLPAGAATATSHAQPHARAAAPGAEPPPVSPWRVTASRHLLRDRWLTLRADTCQVPGGPTLDPYYVLEERDWVHVFALHEDGRVVVVQQYRHAAGVITLELPGGIVDDGETPLAAARRELREETGFLAREWTPAGWLHANPARQTNRVHLFLARGLSAPASPAPDDGEQVTTGAASEAQLHAWIADGRWSQSLHVASLHVAFRQARALGWLADTARSGAQSTP